MLSEGWSALRCVGSSVLVRIVYRERAAVTSLSQAWNRFGISHSHSIGWGGNRRLCELALIQSDQHVSVQHSLALCALPSSLSKIEGKMSRTHTWVTVCLQVDRNSPVGIRYLFVLWLFLWCNIISVCEDWPDVRHKSVVTLTIHWVLQCYCESRPSSLAHCHWQAVQPKGKHSWDSQSEGTHEWERKMYANELQSPDPKKVINICMTGQMTAYFHGNMLVSSEVSDGDG